MYLETEITIDSLIEENASCLGELPDLPYMNLNYGLRTVLNYLVSHYEEHSDFMYASDHLAKLIAQIESFQ